MNKFIERLKRVSQPLPQPMGFGAAKTDADRPKIQLVALVSNTAASLAGQLTMVDAIVMTSVKKNNPENLWGVWFKKGDADEAEQAIKAKADFGILPFEGAVLSSEVKIGKILQIDASATDIVLRAANELPVDAFVLDQEKIDKLTWQRLLLVYRFGGLLTKPVLVTVPLSITSSDLQLIWEAGICGVIIEVNDEAAVEALKKIREIIDALPFPSKKKKEKMSPTLPQVSAPTGEEAEEPDEDDDDGDDE